MANNNLQAAWNFISEPNLNPTKINITIYNKDKIDNSEYIFTSPFIFYGDAISGQTGSLIMDILGNPIWFRKLDSIYLQNADFRVQKYKGKPVLTMWEGCISGTQTKSP